MSKTSHVSLYIQVYCWVSQMHKMDLKSNSNKANPSSYVNKMWIIKNARDIQECLSSNSLTFCKCKLTFEFFSTLSATLPLDRRQSVLRDLIHQSFIQRLSSLEFLVKSVTSFIFVKFTCNSCKIIVHVYM